MRPVLEWPGPTCSIIKFGGERRPFIGLVAIRRKYKNALDDAQIIDKTTRSLSQVLIRKRLVWSDNFRNTLDESFESAANNHASAAASRSPVI